MSKRIASHRQKPQKSLQDASQRIASLGVTLDHPELLERAHGRGCSFSAGELMTLTIEELLCKVVGD